MIDSEDKENAGDYVKQKKVAFMSYDKSADIANELGCVPLSDSEDDVQEIVQAPVTEEFLDKAERCLLDIETNETEEEVKMKLINLLYQQIQLQRQGQAAAIPMTYITLKNALVRELEEDMEVPLGMMYLQSHEGEGDEEGEEKGEGEKTDDRVEKDEGEEDQHFDLAAGEKNPDDIVIAPKKTFDELLQEELEKEETERQMTKKGERDAQLMPPPPSKLTPKRTFLKRGEGIARFSSAPVKKPPKPMSKSATSKNGVPPKRTVGLIRGVSSEKPRPKLPSKLKIEDSLTIAPGRDPAKSARCTPVMSPVRSPDSSPAKSPQPSISNRLFSAAKHTAEISGFLNLEQLEEHQRAAEEELDEFVMLEQAAADKSINSLIGMLKYNSGPVGGGSCATIVEESPSAAGVRKRSGEEEEDEEYDEQEDFDDEETWGFGTPVKPSNVAASAFSREVTSNGMGSEFQENKEVRKAGPSKLLGNLFPGLKPPAPPQPEKPVEKQSDVEYESLKAELKRKLAELEKEVNRFQTEAAGLARARAEKESELRKLRTEHDKCVCEIEEREKQFQEHKERELKMLRAEKKQFEMSQLSAKQRAAKLELVDSLTARVTALEDELIRKEERWNATFTRLKNKGEGKERECEDLHKQISILEQEKLALWEKEVIRTSSRRHKHCQTLPPPPAPKTEAIPTPPSDCTSLKPSLKARHPQLEEHVANGNFRTSNGSGEVIMKPRQATTAGPRQATEVPRQAIVGPHQAVAGPRQAIAGPNQAIAGPRQAIAGPNQAIAGLRQVITKTDKSDPDYINLYQAEPSQLEQYSRESALPACIVSKISSALETPLREQAAKTGKGGSVESIGADGSVSVSYSNGTVKHISTDGRLVTMTYFNGDTKRTHQDGRVVYTFEKDGITQTQFPDGTEKTLFATGQEETKHADGRVEIKYPDKSTKITSPDGQEKSLYSDGTVVTVDKTGNRLIVLPSGQREIHTSAFKRREYPDGTSKTVYTDGRQETVHANGRIRKKDPKGNLVSDVTQDTVGNVIHDFLVSARR